MPISHSSGTFRLMAGQDAQVEDLAKWLWSEDGRRTAQRALLSRGLAGVAVDDLVNQTFERVAARIRRRGAVELDEGRTIAAYAATAMKRIVLDLIRGEKKDGLGNVRAQRPDDTPRVEDLGDATIDVEEFVLGQLGDDEILDAMRIWILARMAGEVWTESAALSFVTLATDPERSDTLGPQPDAGAEGTWRYWTSLWLAGRVDVLPDRSQTSGDQPARRQQRSRAIAKIRELLLAAHASVSEGTP
jgi:hypothetical protein